MNWWILLPISIIGFVFISILKNFYDTNKINTGRDIEKSKIREESDRFIREQAAREYEVENDLADALSAYGGFDWDTINKLRSEKGRVSLRKKSRDQEG